MTRQGFTVWFTGLPRSGKTAIARVVEASLRDRGMSVEYLNSAKIRKQYSQHLGFSRDEVETSVQRLIYECTLLNRNGVVAVVTAISPYREMRESARKSIERYVEVYCTAPMAVLESRDTTGLFARARRKEIQNVAGVDVPYDEPTDPEVRLDTETVLTEASASKVIETLESLGHIEATESSTYTADEEEMIKRRLRDLGYL